MPTANKTAANATAKTVAVNYAREACMDVAAAVKGMVAAESGCARSLGIAMLATQGGANSADGIKLTTMREGLKRSGFAGSTVVFKQDVDKGKANAEPGDIVISKNEIARARPWFYCVENADNAETLAGIAQAAWTRIGDALLSLEIEQAKNADPKEDDAKPVTLDDGIRRAKEGVKKAIATAHDKKKEPSQDVQRAAKALGVSIPKLPKEEPAPTPDDTPKPGAIVTPKPSDAKSEDAPKPMTEAERNAIQNDSETPPAAPVERPDKASDLLHALLTAMDSNAVAVAGAIKLTVKGGGKVEALVKRINMMRDDMGLND